jgi:hypothetical protein
MKFKDFYGNVVDDTEDDLVDILKQIYDGKLISSYCAATLLCRCKDTIYEFNIRSPDILDRLNYWVAKIYVKYKTPNHVFWDDCHKIIKYCEERNIT